jgi:hypothetical protein
MSDDDHTIDARLRAASERLIEGFSDLDTEADLRAVRSGPMPEGGAPEDGSSLRWLAVGALRL